MDQPDETGPHSSSEEHSSSEDDDQARSDKDNRAERGNMTPPADVDLVNFWNLLEKCDAPESASIASMPLHEPSIALHKDGLPATHTCEHCEHCVVNASACSAFEKVQRVLVAKSREELACAEKMGCILVNVAEIVSPRLSCRSTILPL